jgi:CheY-like chemotaxis protein
MAPDPGVTGSARVLVVEDEESVGEILADVLADAGYEVRRARNGLEGLRVIGDWLPQVIILDLMMPVMDGFTFRAEQRRLGGREAAVPVIVLSGARDMRTRDGELQAVEAISKPFELDDVLAAVERWT